MDKIKIKITPSQALTVGSSLQHDLLENQPDTLEEIMIYELLVQVCKKLASATHRNAKSLSFTYGQSAAFIQAFQNVQIQDQYLLNSIRIIINQLHQTITSKKWAAEILT